MLSGIIVYRADQGEYCVNAVYDSNLVKASFALMEATSLLVVNSRIGSRQEIERIDGALERILKKVNMEPMHDNERQASINSAFQLN